MDEGELDLDDDENDLLRATEAFDDDVDQYRTTTSEKT